MPTIYQEIRQGLKKIEKITKDRVKKEVKEEIIHENLTERFRGKSWSVKLQAIITIWTA